MFYAAAMLLFDILQKYLNKSCMFFKYLLLHIISGLYIKWN